MTNDTIGTSPVGFLDPAAVDLPLYLPVPGSDLWPVARPAPGTRLAPLVGRLAIGLSSLADDLSSDASPAPTEFHRELRFLAALAVECTSFAQPTIEAVEASNNRKTSDLVMRELLTSGHPPRTIERYAAYDQYFNVMRLGVMTQEEMLAQVLVVSGRVLEDLSDAFLARDEIISLLVGLAIMISGDGTLDLAGSEAAAQPNVVSMASSCEHRHLDRWIAGHHAYILFIGYCRRFLEIGLEPNVDGEVRAIQIGIAGSLLRAATAAMWYASEVPPTVYLNQVRPSMPPDGFSGEHNADHMLLRSSKQRLVTVATHMAKNPHYPWEHKVLTNMERFLELDLEDTEAHILLAASKVGRQASLAQNAAVGEDALPQTTAVDMLRSIAKQKQSASAGFFRLQLKTRTCLHLGGGGPDPK